MKKLKIILVAVLLFVFLQISFGQDTKEFLVDSLEYKEDLLDSNETYKSMYDSLENDGKWVSIKKSEFIKEIGGEEANDIDEEYYNSNEILYFWLPNIMMIDINWSPYINGYWSYTLTGWTWISYYHWGWTTYNYGRWWWSAYYGWVWIPGRIWAPNWCIWRHYHNYIGWYPAHPRIWWHGHHHKRHHNHIVISDPKHWNFVEKKDFNKKIDNSILKKDLEIAKNSSRLVNNYSKETNVKYNGPNIKTISPETGRKIDPVIVDPKTKNANEDTKYNEKSKVEIPKVETPKREQPKYDQPKKDVPKYEVPKSYTPPRNESPKQSPKTSPPREKSGDTNGDRSNKKR